MLDAQPLSCDRSVWSALSHADVCCIYLYKCFESCTLMMHVYLYMFSSYRMVCACLYLIYMLRLWLGFIDF